MRLSLASIAREFNLTTRESSGYGFRNKQYSISIGYQNNDKVDRVCHFDKVYHFNKEDKGSGVFTPQNHTQFNTLTELREHMLRMTRW